MRETKGRGAMAAKWKAVAIGLPVLWRRREREGGGGMCEWEMVQSLKEKKMGGMVHFRNNRDI